MAAPFTFLSDTSGLVPLAFLTRALQARSCSRTNIEIADSDREPSIAA